MSPVWHIWRVALNQGLTVLTFISCTGLVGESSSTSLRELRGDTQHIAAVPTLRGAVIDRVRSHFSAHSVFVG